MSENEKKKAKPSRVPTSRAERLARIGLLTGEFALGGAAEGVRRLLGAGTSEDNLFLNPAGAERLARRLARMRGAAMKLGQMISLFDDELLPKEFAEALSILRDSADTMPESQVRQTLVNEYGEQWWKKFESFDFEPIASASIGQVHTATTPDGRDLALKIQYPGVAESIDSDISNLAAALKAARILPIGLDIDGIVEQAKVQLRQEADYLSEARYLQRYKEHLGDDPRYRVPDLIEELTTSRILAMERLLGVPLEDLSGADYTQQQRDDMGSRLVELLLRELFEFRLMQTDPNFANYMLQPEDGRLGLLDFGSSSEISNSLSNRYRALFEALRDTDREGIRSAVEAIGFLEPDDSQTMKDRLVDLFLVVFEPFARPGPFDYGSAKIMSRAQEMGLELAFKHGYMRTPPPETMFLHRKLDGTLLLCSRIRARVDFNGILKQVLEETQAREG